MKRICLFAGYDSKNIIHDYVVYYLKELSTVADVYYMADNEISDEEKEKIAPYVKGAYGFNHKKYDFGSWQELIKIIGWEKLSEYDELILANDSVFGPLYPIKELFEKLEKDKEWDICGMDRVYNANRNIWYISSYFLLFKKNAFLSDIFKIHMESITIEKNLLNVINKYEIPFMEKFYNNAYIVKSLLSEQYQIYYSWRENIAEGNPFVKRKVFLKSHFLGCNSFGWEEYIKNTSKYPIEFIKDYLKDNKNYSENIDELIKNNELKTKLSLKEKLVKIRQWIIQINIKKNKKKIRILGLYILNTNSQIIPISLINKGKTK